jgi:hypothetical protein
MRGRRTSGDAPVGASWHPYSGRKPSASAEGAYSLHSQGAL